MKTHVILFLLLMTSFLVISCDDNTNISKGEGKVVFYTDVQAKLNCGPFNVDIFIENDSVGSISEPYLDEMPPECKNTALTLMLEKQVGVYKYTAKMGCGQYGQWSGEFEILHDSCSKIFLDIDNCNPKQ